VRLACPSCKTSNEPDAGFCKKCGKKLGSDEASDDAKDAKDAKVPAGANEDDDDDDDA